MTQILVTGATGTVGSEVVAQLLAAGADVRAMSRDPETAELPSGVTAVRGDLTEPQSLAAALDGIDTLFLVWTAPAPAAEAAIAAIAQHARRVVFLTAPHQTPHPFFQQPNAMATMQADIERRIMQSNLRWTFIRPSMFAANARMWWAGQIRTGDVVRWPYGDAPTAPIHERDIAAVAVRALLDDSHDGGDFVITGPESLTQREQVEILGEVLHRPLRFEELTPDEARRELAAPPPVITMLLNAWSAALGQPAYLTDKVEAITGRAPRTFREWAADHAHDFLA
ncbi:MAG TPA: NAD(P)H-binding protein [Thermoanaerobaculia bacterium]|nr:NAD(P)H-binding protein [Thermoanaerobaculia bacterium]